MIRPYVSTDREALINIFKLNTPEFFDPKEIADFEAYLDEFADTYFTTELEGKIVGGTGYCYSENNTVGHVTWILFHPNTKGMGLGKKAVEHCFEHFKSNLDLKKIEVTTSQLAYRFFEKLGFTLLRTQKDYWGKGLDLYVMEKEW